MACDFCNSSEIEERMIIKNDLMMAFPTNIPVAPGHVLLCPVRHAAKFENLTKQEIEALFDIQLKLKTVLMKAFSAEGFNFAWNEGKSAGQEINHFHMHMIPRTKNDSNVDPRNFLYRTQQRPKLGKDELRSITNTIRKFL